MFSARRVAQTSANEAIRSALPMMASDSAFSPVLEGLGVIVKLRCYYTNVANTAVTDVRLEFKQSGFKDMILGA